MAATFRILGPLEVLDADRAVALGGGRQRALLAILLLRANQVVSTDQLIDGLWGEAPPPTARQSVHVYVSQLRRVLPVDGAPDGRTIETRAPGYLLHVAHGQLDLDRFEALFAEGRAALADGDPERASGILREALGLWRGAPLADFAFEDFAQRDIGRLEERRLTCMEERIEADLALGRHGDAVAELEALVAEHPVRERLRGQLMLALYRSGRQAEALDTYQQGRRSMADELGLDPSEELRLLERQILEQSPALRVGTPSKPTGPIARTGRPPITRWPILTAVAGAALLLGALLAFLVTRGDDPIPTAGAAVLDPTTGRQLAAIGLGGTPSSVTIGEGSVWVLDANDRTISRLDPRARRLVLRFSTPSTPTDIAAGAGALWVGNASTDGPPGSSEGLLPASVARVDPESGLVVDTIPLRPRLKGAQQLNLIAGISRQHIAVTHDAVWVVNADLTVSRIDPRTNRVVAVIEDLTAWNIASGDGEVWIAGPDGLAEIDPSVTAVSRRISIDGFLAGLAVGAGAVWVADPLAGRVWRVESSGDPAPRPIAVGPWVAGLSFGEGAVWATSEIADDVYRIDPRTSRSRMVSSLTAPHSVAAGEGVAWVTAASPPSRDATLPASVCGDVFFTGRGSPRLLLVSDLPLQGPSRPFTEPMVAGIRLVLEQRGFQAGGFSVGHQSCDSSTAQGGGPDFFRCGSNAKAYARNLSVVAVIGPFTSFCSFSQIPITNEAPDGPLAMISPSNTVDELTEDEELYPTGTRNYVRIAAQDHRQGAAQVELARQLGKRRMVVLVSSDGSYGPRFPATVRATATALGLQVVGTATYDPDARDLASFVSGLVRMRPDAVVIAGIPDLGTSELIRQLRATFGRDVPIMVPDAFYGVPRDIVALTRRAAEGLYVTNYGVPNSRLPARGKRFLEDLAQARARGPGRDFSASYGAQTAEIMLDAIARSDGTRASVTKQVLATHVENGILGDIRFDRNGDLVEAPITVHRVVGDRFVVDRVVTVRPSQLAGGSP